MSHPNLPPSLLSWLRCFNAVANTRSFTHAAQNLHITQSAVSQQVRQLENRLGVRLFERQHQKISLTEDGKRLFDPVRDAFLSLGNIVQEFDQSQTAETLEIICIPSFAMRWLMPRMGHFFATHPHIPVRLQADFNTLENRTRETPNGVTRLTYAPFINDGTTSPILDEWLFPVASPSFLAAHPLLLHPSDLLPSMLLHDDMAWHDAAPYTEWQCWLQQFGLENLALDEGHRFNLSMLAVEAALAGRGIAMGRSAIVLEDIIAGRLVNVFKQCVRSPAMYLFHADMAQSPVIGPVKQWLLHQAHAFHQLRSQHLPSP